MHTKTMEGLVGASMNMELLNTPFRVYKEARRRGDTATMERAMGYVNDFSNRADEYKTKADEGMKEDAEEARKKAESEREIAIQKRREEREKLEERIAESRDKNEGSDTVEVSEEGKLLLKENIASDGNDSSGINADINYNINHNINLNDETFVNVKVEREPVIYTKNGEVNQPEQGVSISVSV